MQEVIGACALQLKPRIAEAPPSALLRVLLRAVEKPVVLNARPAARDGAGDDQDEGDNQHPLEPFDEQTHAAEQQSKNQ